MKKYIIGIDIGGTKCAVLLGRTHGGVEDIITDKLRFETRVSRGWRAVTAELLDNVEELLKRNALSPEDILCAGISCGRVRLTADAALSSLRPISRVGTACL